MANKRILDVFENAIEQSEVSKKAMEDVMKERTPDIEEDREPSWNKKVSKIGIAKEYIKENLQYTERNGLYRVQVKDRKELGNLVGMLKEDNRVYLVKRSMVEGYRYEVVSDLQDTKKINEGFDSLKQKEFEETPVKEEVKEERENPLANLEKENMFTFPNGEYVYVAYEDGKLYAGGATNAGIFHDYEIDYDWDEDLDKNLERLYNVIIEARPELEDEFEESCEECKEELVEEQVATESACNESEEESITAETWKDTDNFNAEEWEDADIDYWKSIDWKEVNQGEVANKDDTITAKVTKYSINKEPEVKEVEMCKYFRANPIFPPYYAAVEKPFDDCVGPMYDGHKNGKVNIHDRYETQEVYDILSESHSKKMCEKEDCEEKLTEAVEVKAEEDGKVEVEATEETNVKVEVDTTAEEKVEVETDTAKVTVEPKHVVIDREVEVVDDEPAYDFGGIEDEVTLDTDVEIEDEPIEFDFGELKDEDEEVVDEFFDGNSMNVDFGNLGDGIGQAAGALAPLLLAADDNAEKKEEDGKVVLMEDGTPFTMDQAMEVARADRDFGVSTAVEKLEEYGFDCDDYWHIYDRADEEEVDDQVNLDARDALYVSLGIKDLMDDAYHIVWNEPEEEIDINASDDVYEAVELLDSDSALTENFGEKVEKTGIIIDLNNLEIN